MIGWWRRADDWQKAILFLSLAAVAQVVGVVLKIIAMTR